MEKSGYHKLVFGSIILVIVLILMFLLPARASLTGKVAVSLEEPQYGEALRGNFAYSTLNEGPLPLDSTVSLAINTYVTKLPLRNFISQELADSAQTIKFSPPLTVVVGFDDYSGGGTPTGDPGAGTTDDSADNAESSGSGGYPQFFLRLLPGITGNAIIEEISVIVHSDKPTSVNVPSGKRAVIKKVLLRGEEAPSNYVLLSQGSGSATITARYTEDVLGFSYSNGIDSIPLNLEVFNSVVKSKYANIEVSVSYKDDKIVSVSKSYILGTAPVPSITPPSQARVQRLTIGELATPTGLPQSCRGRVICTEFGSCSLPALSVQIDEKSISKPMQARQCVYSDCGISFTNIRACTLVVPRTSVEKINLGKSANIAKEVSVFDMQKTVVDNHEWKETIDPKRDLSTGVISVELGKDDRIKGSLNGHDYFIGNENVNIDEKSATIIVSGSNDGHDMKEGDHGEFDIDNDNVNDISVTLVSVDDNGAFLSVVPLTSNFALPVLQSGEKAVSIIKSSTKQPVAHIFISDKPSMRVFLVQSNSFLPEQCSNGIKDANEQAVDCGIVCRPCKAQAEVVNRGFYFSWIFFVVCMIVLMIATRIELRRQKLQKLKI